MKETFEENLNNEKMEGELSSAVESLPQAFESYEMPKMVMVNGEPYPASEHALFTKTFEEIAGEDKETSGDMSGVMMEAFDLARKAQEGSKEAKIATITNAFASTEIEGAAEEIQKNEAQQIVAETEGKKGILESLSEHKKKMMAALALISGLSAAAPSFAQQRNVDWGRIGETAVLIGAQIARERGHVDLGGDTRQVQRESRDIERERRYETDTRYETSELGSNHRFERESFIRNRNADIERMGIEGRSQRDIQLYQIETRRVLDLMQLRHQREREAFEIRMGRQVEHGRIGSQREGRDIEINRGYGHGRIDIERRNIEVQQGVQIFRQIFGR